MLQGQREIAAPGTKINDRRPRARLTESGDGFFPESFGLRTGHERPGIGSQLDGTKLDRPFEMLQWNTGESLPDELLITLPFLSRDFSAGVKFTQRQPGRHGQETFRLVGGHTGLMEEFANEGHNGHFARLEALRPRVLA
jgi:hypothetical protein